VSLRNINSASLKTQGKNPLLHCIFSQQLNDVPPCGACFGNQQDSLGLGANLLSTYPLPLCHLSRKNLFPFIASIAI
jgi:hypothetical protein